MYSLLCFLLCKLGSGFHHAHSIAQMQRIGQLLPFGNITIINNITCYFPWPRGIQRIVGNLQLFHKVLINLLLTVKFWQYIAVNITAPCFKVRHIAVEVSKYSRDIYLENTRHVMQVTLFLVVCTVNDINQILYRHGVHLLINIAHILVVLEIMTSVIGHSPVAHQVLTERHCIFKCRLLPYPVTPYLGFALRELVVRVNIRRLRRVGI